MPDDNVLAFADQYEELPNNIEAEKALLGAILVNNDVVDVVADTLRGEYFYQPVHGRIYDDVLTLTQGGAKVTPITLRSYYENDDALANVGGGDYLAQLAGDAVTITNAADYADVIHALWVRRRVLAVCADLSSLARNPEVTDSADTYVEAMGSALDTIADTSQDKSMVSRAEAIRVAGHLVEEAMQRKRVVGATTGLTDLDRVIGGLENGNLIVVAGATSMGKTVLAQNIARNVASDRGDERPVLYFSMEMDRAQIGMRELSRVANVPLDQLRTGRVEVTSPAFSAAATITNDDVRMWIDDEPRLTVQHIHARCRKMRRRNGLGLVIVDFLQEIQSAETYRGSRAAEVSEIAYGIKYMARSLQVPVILVSQLSRMHNQRDDKRPMMQDLKESGDIENAADVILLLYRLHYYQPERPDDSSLEEEKTWEGARNRLDIIIAKQRQGKRGGTVHLFYDETVGRIGDMAHPQQEDFQL